MRRVDTYTRSSMSFFILEPEVPGGLGDRSQLIHRPGEHPVVKRLHFEFGSGSSGDDLFTSHPVFMVTRALGDALRNAGLSGFDLSNEIEVSVDEQVRLLEPDWRAPDVQWLQIRGAAGSDDFGVTETHSLVVSAAALSVLRGHKIAECRVLPFVG